MTTYQESKLVDRYVGLTALIERALPVDHPVAERVREAAKEVRAEAEEVEEDAIDGPDYYGVLFDLVERVEDWRRGIRDWSEVDEALRTAREAL